MAEKITRYLVRPEEQEEFDAWRMPDVSHDIARPDKDLFGHVPGELVLPLDNDLTMMPPTMAELEQIRLEAEQEGFAEGRAQGLEQGLEAGRLEGLMQGHQQGFSQGEQQGYEQGMAKAVEMMSRFDGLISQFMAPLSLLDDEIEYQLLQLTQALIQAVIGHELSIKPEHILHTLKQGIAALPLASKTIAIRLHPDDIQLVTTLYGAEHIEHNGWQLQADPCLGRGDCQIASGRSLVDLSLQQRLQAVLAQTSAQMQQLSNQINDKQATLAARSSKANAPSDNSDNSDCGETSQGTDSSDNQFADSETHTEVTAASSQLATGQDGGTDASTDEIRE
ncbi:MAG: flagellar assembly protein FliH [Shewanella sp.]